MPTLLLEIGCEELPASACREAEAQLPELSRQHLGVTPDQVLVGPRRIALIVEDLPAQTEPEWVKGPPTSAPDAAREGFGRRHGVDPAELEERDGFLGVERPGEPVREILPERLAAIVTGLSFGKSMQWVAGGLRFARPVRWLLAKLDSETIDVALADVPSGSVTHGHRFTHGEIEIADAGAYVGYLRNAAVEPDAAERRRQIVTGLDAIGGWSDPAGVLEEVVYLVESPRVLEGGFDEAFLALPPRVVETAMQSHQRYFPLGGARFAFVANGGDRDIVRAGNEQVLEGRLDDASFTFERDVQLGIERLGERLEAITFFAGAGSFAEKTQRLVKLVERLGGGDASLEAARLAKADQAAELVREFTDLEGHIGAEYARLAGYPEAVCAAIDEQYLPDSAGGPLPQTEAGKVLAAADKIDNLTVSFGLGHRPTGSRDPFGLRRGAIGLCRLADEGGLRIERALLDDEVRDFVEERLEGLLDLPVELVRAARGSDVPDLGGVAALARYLAALPEDQLAPVHEVYTRAARISGPADDQELDSAFVAEPAEQELLAALSGIQTEKVTLHDFDGAFASAAALAPIVQRFFEDVLVMAEDSAVRANRLRLLRDVRNAIGALGDFSQLQR
jgi:tetrameric-type glycyl-tRNA synthetase beta subunit